MKLLLPLLTAFLRLTSAQPSLVQLTSANFDSMLTFFGTPNFVCYMTYVDGTNVASNACDVDLSTYLRGQLPYPTVNSAFDGSFYIQFSGSFGAQISSFMGDVGIATSILVDVLIVPTGWQAVRGDSRFVCQSGIFPNGVFNCPFPIVGNYIMFWPLTGFDAGNLVMRTVRVWSRKDLAGSGTVALSSGATTGTANGGLQEIIGSSNPTADSWIEIKTGGYFNIDLGSVQSISGIWLLFKDTAVLGNHRFQVSYGTTAPTSPYSNCAWQTLGSDTNGEEWIYTNAAEQGQYVIIGKTSSDGCSFPSTEHIYIRKIAVFGASLCQEITSNPSQLTVYSPIVLGGEATPIPWPSYSTDCGLKDLLFQDSSSVDLVVRGDVVIDWVTNTITYKRVETTGFDAQITMYAVFYTNTNPAYKDTGTVIQFIDCRANNVIASPGATAIFQLGSAVSITTTKSSNDAACVYSTSYVQPVGANLILTNGASSADSFSYSITADLTSPVQTNVLSFYFVLTSSTAAVQAKFSVSVDVKVTCPVPVLTTTYTPVVYGGEATPIPWPTYTITPANCYAIQNLLFKDASNADLVARGDIVVDLVSKTITYKRIDTTGFDAQITMYAVFNTNTGLPAFTNPGVLIEFIDCKAKNFVITKTPSNGAVSQLGSALKVTISKDSANAACLYSTSYSQPTGTNLLFTNGVTTADSFSYSITADLTSPVQIVTITFAFTLTSSTAAIQAAFTTTASVQVTCPQITVDPVLVTTYTPIVYGGKATPIPWPTYTINPANCYAIQNFLFKDASNADLVARGDVVLDLVLKTITYKRIDTTGFDAQITMYAVFNTNTNPAYLSELPYTNVGKAIDFIDCRVKNIVFATTPQNSAVSQKGSPLQVTINKDSANAACVYSTLFVQPVGANLVLANIATTADSSSYYIIADLTSPLQTNVLTFKFTLTSSTAAIQAVFSSTVNVQVTCPQMISDPILQTTYTPIVYGGEATPIPWPTYTITPANCYALQNLLFKDASNADLVARGDIVVDLVLKTIKYKRVDTTGIDAQITMYAVFNTNTNPVYSNIPAYTNIGFVIQFIDCKAKNIIVTPAASAVSQLGSALQILISKDTANAACVYSTSYVQPAGANLILTNGASSADSFSYSITADLTSPVQTNTLTFKFTLTSSTAAIQAEFTKTASVQVTCPQLTIDPVLVTTYTPIVYGGEATPIPWPTYTINPANCYAIQNLLFKDASNADLVARGDVVLDLVLKTITYKRIDTTGFDAQITMYAVFNTNTNPVYSHIPAYTNPGVVIQFTDCKAKNLLVVKTPAIDAISKLGPALQVTINKDSANVACIYSTSYSQPIGANLIFTNGMNTVDSSSYSIAADLTSPMQTSILTFTFTLTSSTAAIQPVFSTTTNIQVTCPAITSDPILQTTYVPIVLGGEATPIPWPNYTITPENCYALQNLLFKDASNADLVARGDIVVDLVLKTIKYKRVDTTGFDAQITMYAVFNTNTNPAYLSEPPYTNVGKAIDFIDCRVKNIVVVKTPSNGAVSQLGPSLKITISKDQSNAACVYSTSYSQPIGANLIFTNGVSTADSFSYSITADLTSPIQTSIITFTFTLTSSTASIQSVFSTTTSVQETCPAITSDPILQTTYAPIVLGGEATPIPFPNYTITPANCYALQNLLFKDASNADLVARGDVVVDLVLKTITYKRIDTTGFDARITMYAVFNTNTNPAYLTEIPYTNVGKAIDFIDCRVKNMVINTTPFLPSLSQLGPALLISISKDSANAACVYSTSYDMPIGANLQLANDITTTDSFSYQITADLLTPTQTNTLTFKFTLTDSTAPIRAVFAKTVNIQVTRCVVVSYTVTPTTWPKLFYVIQSPIKAFSFPTFTQVPACNEPLNYVVTSISPFVSYNASFGTSFFVNGSNVSFNGPKTVQIKAIASISLTAHTETLTVEMYDCTPKGLLATPNLLWTTQLAYSIGVNVFTLLSKDVPPVECGTYTYSIVTNPAPPYIFLTSNQLTHKPNLSDSVGDSVLIIKETNNLVPLSQTVTIAVTIEPCKIVKMTPDANGASIYPKTLIIGGPPLLVSFNVYVQTPLCQYHELFKDLSLNFDLTEEKSVWKVSVAKGTTTGTKAIKPRVYYNEDAIFSDLPFSSITVIKVECDKLPDFEYTISDSEEPVETKVNLIDLLALKLSADITPAQLQFNITQSYGKPLPSFITFDSLRATFAIKTSDTKLAADYFIDIVVYSTQVHPEWYCKFNTWKLSVKSESLNKIVAVKNKLILMPDPQDAEVRPGDDWTYKIPVPAYLIVDQANDASKIKLSVSLSSIAPIKYDESAKQLVLLRPIQEADVGKTVTVKYALSDGTITAEYIQTVAFRPKEIEVKADTATVLVSEPVKPQPNPFSVFDPSKYYSGKSTRANQKSQSDTEKKKSPLSFDIKTINNSGQIFVAFSEPMVVPTKYLNLDKSNKTSNNSTISETNKQRLLESREDPILVRIVPGSESSVSNLTYTWNVTSFTENDLTISVYFDNAKYVSVHEDLDSVQVIFIGLNLFVAQSGAVLDKPLSLIQVLPRQMQPDSAEVSVANAATSASTGVKSFVIGNVIMSTVLSASLNMLFQMVEAQQIVCLITCSQITLPPLPATIVAQFFQIANFDILNVFYVYEKIFYMPTIPAINPNFAAVGFGDTYFINNLGSIILSIFSFIGLQSLSGICRKFKKKSKYIKEKWHGIQPTCFWNMPIKVIMTSYSIMALSALMTVRKPQWKYSGPIIDTCCGFIGLVVTIVFPFIVLYLMITKFQDFRLKYIQQRFGSLYEELDIYNKWIIGYRIWFLLRRMLLAVIVVFLENLTYQILLWFLQEIITLVILGYGYPFNEPSMWRSEMWNEVFILSTIYFTMFFSPYISNVDILNGLGYCFVGILFFHLLVNIVKIAIVTVIQKTKEFKQWLIIQKEKKRVKKLIAERHKSKEKEFAKNFTFRRLLSNNLDVEDDEEMGPPQPRHQIRFGRRVQPLNQTGPMLAQIEEEDASHSSSSDHNSSSNSSSSLSSYYNEDDAINSDDYAINHGQQRDELSSVTLNDNEEEVKFGMLKNKTSPEGWKKASDGDDVLLEGESKLIYNNGEGIGEFMQRQKTQKVQEDKEPSFKSASSFLTDSQPSQKGDVEVKLEHNKDEKNQLLNDNKQSSLGELITIIEAERNSRYQQTDKESEMMRDLSESRLAQVNYDYEQNLNDLLQLQKKKITNRVQDFFNINSDYPDLPARSKTEHKLKRNQFVSVTTQGNLSPPVESNGFFQNRQKSPIEQNEECLLQPQMISPRSDEIPKIRQYKPLKQKPHYEVQSIPQLSESSKSQIESQRRQHHRYSSESRHLQQVADAIDFYHDYKEVPEDNWLAKVHKKNSKIIQNSGYSSPVYPKFVVSKRKIEQFLKSVEPKTAAIPGRKRNDLLRAQTLGKLILNQKPSILDKSGLPSARNRSYVSEERKQ